VLTRTVVEPSLPPDGLLQLCEAPVLKPTQKVRDIQENRIRAETAFEKCAARMRCLIWWVASAADDAPPAECRKEDEERTDGAGSKEGS
jgi:hypothetical protein